MSGTSFPVGSPSGYNALANVVADSAAARQRLDQLTIQAGSGHVAETYGGLGAAAAVSLSLRPALASNQATQAGIGAATGPMQVAQSALTSISAIASTFYADTDKLNGLDAGTVDSIAAQAQDALRQVAGLLDSRDGDTYVFAGQDSANPPIPNPDAITSSGFYTQIQAAVAGLAGSGSAAVIASTLATATSNAAGTSPFSAALSQPAATLAALRPSVQVAPGQSVPTGILASANADIASSGANTTGSYTRDIFRALATLASLSSSQIGTTGFSALVDDARTTLGGAISALNQDAGVMGNRQSQLTAMQTQLASTATALTTQISGVEDVDMTTTLTNLTAAQTRLQASYQLISTAQSLSLTNFIQ